MIEIIYDFLCNKLTESIVNEFIVPFAYQTQSSDLLKDIRSYVIDKNICDIAYPDERYPFNEKLYLFYNLVDFSVNYDVKNHNRVGKIIKYRKNNIRDSYATTTKIFLQCIQINFFVNLLLASLTPEERTLFINKFIINESENLDTVYEDMTVDNNGEVQINGNGEMWW